MELSFDEIIPLVLPLGSSLSLETMSGGYYNNNYLLTTTLGKYRLRVPKFASNMGKVISEQQVLKWVGAKSSLPIPLLHVLITVPNGLPISVFPYIEADSVFDIQSEKLIKHAGKVLSEYHQAVEGYKGNLPFKGLSESMNTEINVDALLQIVEGQHDTEYPILLSAIHKLFIHINNVSDQINNGEFNSLPHIVCHGDYAPANLLSVKDEVVGMIDFECCCWAPRVYDVAIGLLAIEQDERYEEKMSTFFLEGYQSNSKLSNREIELIPEFQRIRTLESAMRHFKRVINRDEQINAGLVMYWSRIV